jgi:urease accessory protein
MVPGDRLDIDINISAHASALITTPASGKVYDVGERALPQRQRIHAHVAAGGTLEWLPQDTLFFNGARYAGDTTIHLQGDAQTILWDIATLGRRAGNHPFIEGQVTQHLALYRDGNPLLLERISLDASSPLLDAPWGLGGARCWGTLIATGTTPKTLLETLRDICEQEASEQHAIKQGPDLEKASARISVTALKPLLVARYLGHCPLHAMRVFERLWTQLRPVMVGREACAPRVWAT